MGNETMGAGGPAHPLRSARRWGLAVLGALVVLVLSYLLAVWTERGQALENAALRGADQVRGEDFADATRALGEITVYSLAVAVALIGLVGLLRRRMDLAVAGVSVVVLGQIITQGLKRFVLSRPELVDVSPGFTQNSFPSGHTTIAMTVLFAVFIVVPLRWRGIATLIVLSWAIGIGAYTTTAKWHRFSDTLGADAVALICGCLASWWLMRRGSIHLTDDPARRGRAIFVGLVTLSTAFLLVIGGILWGVPLLQGWDVAVPDPVQDYSVYLGAHTLATGFSGLTALIFWRLWHRLDTTQPNPSAHVLTDR